MKLRVATRGSKLSLIQVKIAMSFLQERLNQVIEFEPVIVTTRGDVVQDRAISQIGAKGVFEKEVNDAVLKGEADVAVHSMKDLPAELSDDLDIAFTPPREVPNDALVVGPGRPEPRDLFSIPSGSVIGTSSVRRSAFLLHYNSKVVVKTLRGNVDTRIEKLRRGEADYLIMAEAGIRRLGIDERRVLLPLDLFPPEPGQGIIAVVAPRESAIFKVLRSASDPVTMSMAVAERKLIQLIGAGCHSPVGAVTVNYEPGRLLMIAGAASPDGSAVNIVRVKGEVSEPELLAKRTAQLLKVPY